MAAVAAPVGGGRTDRAPAGPGGRPRPGLRGPSAATAAGLGLALVALVLGLRPLSDNSFLTHVATGRLLLDGGVPTADPYTFTAAGHPWVVQSWLASLGYGVVDRLAGGTGLLLLNGLLCAALTGLVWRLTRPAGALAGRALVGALVVGMGASAWLERPFLMAIVLLAVALVAAEGGLRPGWLVPVGWVWVNVHGSFPLGLVAVALLAAGRRLDGDRPATEVRAGAALAAGMLLGALNPLGPRLLWFPVLLLGRSDVLRHVAEWQPPTFAYTWQWLFLALAAVAALGALRGRSWRVALPTAAFTGLALLSARNLAVAAVVLVPGAAAALRVDGRTGEGRSPRTALAAAGIVAVAAVALVAAAGRPAFSFDRYPVAALAWAGERGLLAPEARLVAPDTVGNYRELTEGAHAAVFLDDRYDLFPREVLDDYLVLVHGGPGWEGVLDRWGAGAVVWPRSLPLAGLLDSSPSWRVAWDDVAWVVAVPQSSIAA